MFLLSMRGPRKGLYSFRPYNWGPFSPDVAEDINLLVRDSALVAESVPGRSWVRYRPTEEGASRAQQAASSVDHVARDWLCQTREFLTTRSFQQLLTDVYREYPDYATKSLFVPR